MSLAHFQQALFISASRQDSTDSSHVGNLASVTFSLLYCKQLDRIDGGVFPNLLRPFRQIYIIIIYNIINNIGWWSPSVDGVVLLHRKLNSFQILWQTMQYCFYTVYSNHSVAFIIACFTEIHRVSVPWHYTNANSKYFITFTVTNSKPLTCLYCLPGKLQL